MSVIALGRFSLFVWVRLTHTRRNLTPQSRLWLSNASQGHNHGSYRMSNKQTKAFDWMPGIILSAAAMGDFQLLPEKKCPWGLYACGEHWKMTACILLSKTSFDSLGLDVDRTGMHNQRWHVRRLCPEDDVIFRCSSGFSMHKHLHAFSLISAVFSASVLFSYAPSETTLQHLFTRPRSTAWWLCVTQHCHLPTAVSASI